MLIAAAVLGLAAAGAAQVPPKSPAPPVAVPAAPPAEAPATPPANDRIFGVLPNYTTVEAAHGLPPLSARQKFVLASEGTFDPVEFGFVGVLAGLNQVTHENPIWGYGWGGYARRYGESFADQAIENVMVQAAFPAAFHQDPRYFQMATGGYWHRFAYAASRIVVTRGDGGQREANVSELGGALAAAGLSNFYEPRGSRTVGNTAEVWGTQVAIDAWSNELREFWPDLKHRVFHKQ